VTTPFEMATRGKHINTVFRVWSTCKSRISRNFCHIPFTCHDFHNAFYLYLVQIIRQVDRLISPKYVHTLHEEEIDAPMHSGYYPDVIGLEAH
jgi:hypothetical protein